MMYWVFRNLWWVKWIVNQCWSLQRYPYDLKFFFLRLIWQCSLVHPIASVNLVLKCLYEVCSCMLAFVWFIYYTCDGTVVMCCYMRWCEPTEPRSRWNGRPRSRHNLSLEAESHFTYTSSSIFESSVVVRKKCNSGNILSWHFATYSAAAVSLKTRLYVVPRFGNCSWISRVLNSSGPVW